MPQDNWRLGSLQFGSPTNNTLRSIAVSASSVYVGEENSGKITKVLQFSKAGIFVRRFSDNFGYVLGIACDPAGNVYVLDRGDSRVKKYDANGTFIREWGRWGSDNGYFFLDLSNGNNMIAVSSNNQVYVCDPGNSRVQVFDTNGTFLRKWGESGDLPGQFPTGFPTTIAVSDKGVVFLSVNEHRGGPIYLLKSFDTNGVYISATKQGYGMFCLAVAKDGVLCGCDGWSYSPSNIYSLTFDSTNGWASLGNITCLSNNGGAFSAEGDYFGVYSNRVSVAYREYAYASNFPSAPAIPHALVLSAAQRPGTNLVDVDYQVTDTDSATVTTALLAVRENDDVNRIGHSIAMKTFIEGTATQVGANQPTGVLRHVTWNMPADWGVDYATIKAEALAKDSRNLLGVHWITVPASDGQPAVQVSSAPITEAQLHNLWLWLIASGQVSQSYYNHPSYGWLGTAIGTTGVFTGVNLATDEYWDEPGVGWGLRTHTLSAGRIYALQQMGAQPITAPELVRAQAGRYGFTSLSPNTIVKISNPATSYLKGWGRSDYGQAAWQSFAAPNISNVVAGGNTTFFIRADASLWAVGPNSYGELGDGTTTSRTGPLQVATGVAQVATGGSHTLFVKTDGTLWAMGWNNYGQLGDNTTTNRSTPVQVASGVAQATAGNSHSLFVKTDGTLWAMGYNGYGQLGDTTADSRQLPVQIATGVAQASAGSNYSLYVKTDGKLYAMGYNPHGQLGDTTTTNRSTPVQIATGVAQACAGTNGYHSVFVKTTGALFAMGYNGYGQLGDGTTTNQATPVQIATGVAQAFAGSNHTVFRKTDNTVWSVGYNNYGQLGDGTTTNRSTAAQFDVNATDLAAGESHTLIITLP